MALQPHHRIAAAVLLFGLAGCSSSDTGGQAQVGSTTVVEQQAEASSDATQQPARDLAEEPRDWPGYMKRIDSTDVDEVVKAWATARFTLDVRSDSGPRFQLQRASVYETVPVFIAPEPSEYWDGAIARDLRIRVIDITESVEPRPADTPSWAVREIVITTETLEADVSQGTDRTVVMLALKRKSEDLPWQVSEARM